MVGRVEGRGSFYNIIISVRSDPLRSAGLKIAQILKEDTFSEEEVKQSLENLEPADGKITVAIALTS